MGDQAAYRVIPFHDFSGYLVSPEASGHRWLAMGHTSDQPPWSDPELHAHAESEEFYLLLRGHLRLHVAGDTLTLRPMEMLFVRPGIAHAVLGGESMIEHFGFRAPLADDRVHCGSLPETAAPAAEDARALAAPWGFRIPLSDPAHRNCWLIGLGAARYPCQHFLFAWLDFPAEEQANAGIGTRLQMHHHPQSWEYYACLKGSKTLVVNGENVVVEPGQMVEVRPGAQHNVIGRQAPYVGFTCRVPLLDDKIVADSHQGE